MNPGPPCLFWMGFLVFDWFDPIRTASYWCSLFTFGGGFCCQDQHISGVCQGGGFSGFGFFLARLSEEVEYSAIFLLWALHTDPMCRRPEPPYAPVCVPYHSDGKATVEVYARPIVGLLTLGCKVDGFPFQG